MCSAFENECRNFEEEDERQYGKAGNDGHFILKDEGLHGRVSIRRGINEF